MLRRILLAAAVTGSVLLTATPALAHIDPDPEQAQAGSTQTVGFTVEHGCDRSPTVQLDMRLPEGVTNPVPEPLDGWESSVADNVVTFRGGPLPADQELTIRITMALPATPDVTIYFPFVQRCEVGEIRWISTAGASADEPAPAMQLTGPVITTTSAAPTTAAAAPTTAAPTTSTAAPTTVAPTTAPVAPSAPASTAVATTVSEGGGASSTGTIVFIAALAAVAVVAGLVVIQARRGRR